MNGLNEDPTWRFACVARLNLLRTKSKPPTIARTWPVRLSLASGRRTGPRERAFRQFHFMRRDPDARAAVAPVRRDRVHQCGHDIAGENRTVPPFDGERGQLAFLGKDVSRLA